MNFFSRSRATVLRGEICLYVNLWMVIWIQMIFSPGAGLQPWGGGAPEVHQGSGPDPQLHDKEDPGDPQKGRRGVHGMSRRSGQWTNILECFIIEVFFIANIWKEYIQDIMFRIYYQTNSKLTQIDSNLWFWHRYMSNNSREEMYWSNDTSTFLLTKYFIWTFCLIIFYAYVFVHCMIIILLTLWQLHVHVYTSTANQIALFVLTDFQEVCESSPPLSPVTVQEALPPSPLPSEASEGSQEDSLVCVGVEEPKSDPEIAKR